jgi:ribose 5-phosphate isomerase A
MNKLPKENAAEFAAKLLKESNYIIFGSGSTVNLVISYIGKFHHSISDLKAVAGSNTTSRVLRENSIQEISIKELKMHTKHLDIVCVDGADEIVFDSNQQVQIILKGHGAALLREKILWEQAQKRLVVAEENKITSHISKYIPIEVVPFAFDFIKGQIKAHFPNVEVKVRKTENGLPLITDNQNNIIEIHHKGELKDLMGFHQKIKQITGVIETGIFGDRYLKNTSFVIGYTDDVQLID